MREIFRRGRHLAAVSFFWSFDRTTPELKCDNIFLAQEYRQSFDAIFKCHTLLDELSFYVNVPSRIDPKDAVVIPVPVGHLVEDAGSPQDINALVAKAREFVMDTLEARMGARGWRASLIRESVETPLSWHSKFNLDRWAILGLSHSCFNILSFRPRTKHENIGYAVASIYV
ncbi:hypothetical protein HIM_04258 [Hirsutella minnesotensis 3608]|uniref:Uncharacterized protein n=1 Tax=Hirsutella minnesotensis 3608 TaxID=1043627 RepID=A0A0F8A663_9HYPO|nr:hypothetical protein HIM_04258 [Hirsutella minnesotensis 3608]